MSLKIFFISDNRDNPNWGCRATSQELINIVDKYVGTEYQMKVVGASDIHNYRPYYHLKNMGFLDGMIHKLANHRRSTNKIVFFAQSVFNIFYSIIGPPIFFADSVPRNFSDMKHLAKLVSKRKILKKELDMIEWADLVICNGEGSVYGDERKGKYNLFLLYVAKKLFGKQTFMINHMFDPKSSDLIDISKEIYPSIDFIAFRDEVSLKKYNELDLEKRAVFIPDAAFNYGPSPDSIVQHILGNPQYIDTFWGGNNNWSGFKKPFVVLGGSSRLTKGGLPKGYSSKRSFLKLVEKIREIGVSVVLSQPCEGDTFMKKVALIAEAPLISIETPTQLAIDFVSGASCYISGRYHPMILSLVSGTPTIAMTSNSHKTKSLHDIVGLEDEPYFEIEHLEEQVGQIVERLKKIIAEEESYRDRISKKVVENRSLIDSHYSEAFQMIGKG